MAKVVMYMDPNRRIGAIYNIGLWKALQFSSDIIIQDSESQDKNQDKLGSNTTDQSFSSELNKMVDDKRIGKYISGRLNISHLCFADDLLVFSDSQPRTASNMKSFLSSFASGCITDTYGTLISGIASTSSWKQILKARNWIAPALRYLIFEGKDINLWFDPWINGKSLKHCLNGVFEWWGNPLALNLSSWIREGIVHGVQLAKDLGVRRLWIESDSMTALAWLNGRGTIPWTAIRMLRKVHSLLNSLVDWKSSHIHREGNAPADILAAHRSAMGEEIIRPSDLWMDIREVLAQDKLQKCILEGDACRFIRHSLLSRR
ncbi:hypothetical protein QJS10_CPB12g00400 [Acorus calamus]|uniref:RNase H type-1 domain-containing protein n=1 Tax=Acorus calamus TaxID=4465 RepID=A0AAV9DP12_ACOCL|nr:hypothetical protein QJS10_CPB12g00400 [Acorus calamus]